MIANASLGRRSRALVALKTTSQDPASSSFNEDDPDQSQSGDVNHSFVVGTTEMRVDNEILTLEMDPEKRAVTIHSNAIPHPSEVWSLATYGNYVAACWGTSTEKGLSLSQNGLVLNANCAGSQGAQSVAWDAQGRLATCHEDGSSAIWKFVEGQDLAVETKYASALAVGGRDLAWDPHNFNHLFVAKGENVCIIDSRDSSSEANAFVGAAGGLVRSLDVNPNRSNVCLAAGDDGVLRFFDTRQPSTPLLGLNDGHTHWITRARFNPFHDQLVLTSSTDASVCLWRAASVSSAPLVDFEVDDEDAVKTSETKESNQQDILVKKFEEHQDSVYGLAWSAVEAWTFASLSYDGKFIVRGVPAVEKYKILL